MSLDSRSSRAWVAVALAALVAVPALAAEMPEPVAAMNVSPGSISWAPRVAYDKLVLTVSGGGIDTSQEFAAGVSPRFVPVDDEGYQLPDGTYTWQLTVIPRTLDLNSRTFRSEVASEDGRTMRAATHPERQVQSGAFTIANGAIADPSLVEQRAAPPASAPAAADIDDSDGAGR